LWTTGTSFFSIALSPGVDVFSGTFYILTYLAIGVLAGFDENPTSTSFFGLRDL